MIGICFFDAARSGEDCFWVPPKTGFRSWIDGDGSVFGVAGFMVTPVVGGYWTLVNRQTVQRDIHIEDGVCRHPYTTSTPTAPGYCAGEECQRAGFVLAGFNRFFSFYCLMRHNKTLISNRADEHPRGKMPRALCPKDWF